MQLAEVAMPRPLLALFLLALLPAAALPHDTESPIRLDLPQGEIHGTELIPHIDKPMPCVVIIGGTLSQDRDGRLFDPQAPPRDALPGSASLRGRDYGFAISVLSGTSVQLLSGL